MARMSTRLASSCVTNLFTEKRVNNRQKIGGIREADLVGQSLGGNGLIELGFGSGQPRDGAVDGIGTNELRHSEFSCPSYP